MALAVTLSTWRTPANWTMFVPQELSREVTCQDTCHTEDLNDYTPIWDKWHFNNSRTRSNTMYRQLASYLFMIKSGAQGILLTSDPTSPTKPMSRLKHDSDLGGVVGLEYYGPKLVIDSFHYHHRPRNEWGVPCQYRIRTRMRPMWTIGIRCQSLTSFSTDGKTKASTLVDTQSPPVFASETKFVIENISDAYFHRQGMWALFATVFKSSWNVTAWAMWAQRMMQETQGDMALTSLSCPKGRRLTSLKTLEPSEKSQQIFNFVKQWRCSQNDSFFVCAKSLANEMKMIGFIDPSDVELLKLWLESLADYAGYTEPRRFDQSQLRKYSLPICVIHSPALVPFSNLQIISNMFPNFYTKCKNITQFNSLKNPFKAYTITKPRRLKNIALVVVLFNSTSFYNIPYLQDLYAKYFSTIIYCGPFEKAFRNFQRNFNTPLSFIEMSPTSRDQSYDCTTRAMLLNYDVRGYLAITDDVLLNMWNFRQTTRNRFWLQKDVHVTDMKNQSFNFKDAVVNIPERGPWWPWKSKNVSTQRKALENLWSSLDQIEKLQNGKSKRAADVVTSFKKMLQENTKMTNGVFFHSFSDIFYVPSLFKRPWCMMAELFSKNKINSDIAIPTLVYGLVGAENVFHLDGRYLSAGEFTKFSKIYKTKHHFIHPWKLSFLGTGLEDAGFLCRTLLPQIVNDLTVKKRETKKKVKPAKVTLI